MPVLITQQLGTVTDKQNQIGIVYGLGNIPIGHVIGDPALLSRRVEPGSLRTPLIAVQVIPETTITAVVPKNIKTNELSESGDLEYVFDLPESLTAPVNKGQVLGTLTVKLDGKTLGEVSLLAGQSLGKSEYIYVIEKIKEIAAHTWFKIVIGVLAGLAVIYITIAIISNFRRIAKRKLKREQEEMRRRNDEQDRR